MTPRERQIKSEIDSLRTKARKLNVEFSDATAAKVRSFLTHYEGDLPHLTINKHGKVVREVRP